MSTLNFDYTNFAYFFTGDSHDVVFAIRILLALTMLVIVSIMDIKTRTVDDKIWIIFVIIGALIYLLDLPTLEETIVIGISIAFTAGMTFAMYRIGLFGGADALGIMTLSVIVPIYNVESNTLLHPLAPIIVLTNAILISLTQIVVNIGRNIAYIVTQKKRLFEDFDGETISRKTMAFLIGYRTVKVSKFAFSMEKYYKNKKEFDFTLKHAEREEFCTRPDTWVTPVVPFLLYLAAGTFVMILVGDLFKVFLNNLVILFT